MANSLSANARLNAALPAEYRGLDRFEARKRVVADLDALGLLEKVEPHRHAVPPGDRSGVPLEPWLTDQWYADAATLAKPAIEAAETGKPAFVPNNWQKPKLEWKRNIQPSCIPRHLWWGTQNTARYGPAGRRFVGAPAAEAAAAAA